MQLLPYVGCLIIDYTDYIYFVHFRFNFYLVWVNEINTKEEKQSPNNKLTEIYQRVMNWGGMDPWFIESTSGEPGQTITNNK